MPVIPPPVLALAGAVVQHRVAPDHGAGPVRKVAAAVMAAASVGLAAGAGQRFRESRTTVEPFHPERATALVTTGPNAVTRKPMYVGMAGLLAAHALARGGVLTALPVAAFVAVIDRWQIRPEEEALQATFGSDYADYRARVPRWLPGLPG